MTMILSYEAYLKKLHGCYLGKAVGGTLGMPREGCLTMDEVTYYNPVPTGMVANDDLDLQVVALEVVRRHGLPVNARHLAHCWTDHLRFYPDEYGVAAKNMSLGLWPPLSGRYTNKFSAGMGAAIRSELWAALAPADPALAVRLCREDAVNDHDGDGVDACIFLTAIESAAYVQSDREGLIDLGLSYIRHNRRMTAAFTDVRRWWAENGDVERVRALVLENYFSQNWTDVTINLCFILLSWLAGGEDFSRCVCTAASLGYDADCTCASLGAILGLINPGGIEEKWSRPIGNQLVLSENIIATHEPDTVDDLIDLIAETMIEVGRYYGTQTVIEAAEDLPVYHGAPAWTRRPTLVEVREGSSLLTVQPLVLRVLYPAETGLRYGAANRISLQIGNIAEKHQEGRLSFHAPEGWTVTAQADSFSLEPGEECTLSLQVEMERRAKRPCRSLLDVTLTVDGLTYPCELGLIEPHSWLRVPTDRSGQDCPEDSAFAGAEIVTAPSNIQPVPPGHYLYTAEVCAIMRMPHTRMVASGTRPLRVWINGQLVSDHDDKQYVPAIHRCKDVAVVDLASGWNRVTVEVLEGDNKPGELFFTFGTLNTWKWHEELAWRLPRLSQGGDAS